MSLTIAERMRFVRRDPQPFRPVKLPAAGSVWPLVVCQATALVTQVFAASMARADVGTLAYLATAGAFALTYASVLWCLSAPGLSRRLRNIAVACLGVTTAVQWRVTDPIVLSGIDEQLHLRTLRDITLSHSLFQPNPLLEVSAYYPGLEALTSLINQVGMPIGTATMSVVVVARLVLVAVICDAVEHMTGSMRAGGFAVAVYAMSSQFVWFNSQFAYQTLALPLGLAAVALIARARHAVHPGLLMASAGACLVAMIVTHHVTSCLTAAFLVMWVIVERDSQARLRICCGAAIAVVGTSVWAMLQWPVIEGYFVPMINDIVAQVTGGVRRAAFTDGSGASAPMWQRCVMIYYAVVVSIGTAWLAVRHFRPHAGASPRAGSLCPRLLLVSLSALIPILFASRIFPSGGEISDRASGFLFLPFSALLAGSAIPWWRDRRGRHSQPPMLQTSFRARVVAIVLATGAFLGGYLAGSGPEWARLPGEYLVSSNRSIDAETLAGVRWAADALPDGSRIGADAMSSLLLASEAGLWPIVNEVAQMYFSTDWGASEMASTARLNLRYLFVDRRLADELPHLGWYFMENETAQPTQLTRDRLDKFDAAQGVREVYRHGPISIYDLKETGVAEVRSGWVGSSSAPSLPTQLLIGLLIGLVMALSARSRLRVTAIGLLHRLSRDAGLALALATIVSVLCTSSVLLLIANVWVPPWTAAVVVVFLVGASARRALSFVRDRSTNLSPLSIAAAMLTTATIVGVLVQAYSDAAIQDVHQVDRILHSQSTSTQPVSLTMSVRLSCSIDPRSSCSQSG